MNEMVSVIMPVYNAEKYVEFAIDSVLAQSYSNWELLIVDDCSTDLSVGLIADYVEKDSRIRLFHTDKPSGSPCEPRNVGIRNAQGRYIAFLDSDDVWLPDKLEEQLRLFDDVSTAIVYSNYEKISEEGERGQRIVTAPSQVSYKELLKGNVIGNLTGIYDTEKVGKIYCRNMHHEDYILWLSILKKGYVARNTNAVHALYRVRKQSVSANKLSVILWQWNIYRNIEKIGCLRACYYFIHYAYRALLKNKK
ncbi:glycosyltransferase family 2 protein [Bacteroides helcogenes]|uniref:Glycosyl transferase family 2 n=1 Tax=Bacteroides helcogenes (strain ATCC 35417 / DSM 20613 / JCM 6297 / CCUG 15421 / P 36-108) TaxID=693979 RepID=E6SVV3_BACT6|nr:glycosyltransferase family 2 protein [Bacteroides helcogenes]ADV44542.1 glycosyl transferase family 2 [Bacteroides helcogenes P 36-108]MDY5238980.1 glycosyltransferase family 2 protein [Bacteroides helcogenes]